ncbi:MAG: hypothetical protein MK289_02130 [Trichodesmium sp. ALOHA_ZT_67]|nr:hypothetical protein [Trichodesmium sp. ALOHA_ZT_67]
MATRLIELENGILVYLGASEDESETISTNFIKGVKSAFAQIKPILISISRPIAEAWQEINKDMEIEQAEVEVGLNFEGQGNIYITKGKGGTNLKVKLVLKPKKLENE